jgi:hypothetical protein
VTITPTDAVGLALMVSVLRAALEAAEAEPKTSLTQVEAIRLFRRAVDLADKAARGESTLGELNEVLARMNQLTAGALATPTGQ